MADSYQKTLQEFLKRRHPRYEELLPHWNFLEATYRGGREWFKSNVFRYVKEGEKEYKERLARAYRFNHTKEAVDLVNKYIFKSPCTRNEIDAPQEVKDFWENATLKGHDINQFMNMASTKSSALGMPWIFTDTTKTEEILSVADQKKAKARVYAYVVRPQDVLDIGVDEQGSYSWVLVRETYRDDRDPIFSSGEVRERFRLWERNYWTLFEVEEKQYGWGKTTEVKIVGSGAHMLGRVPGFPLPHVIGDDPYAAPSLINDIAYLDRAVANYLSNLDAIIQDQTFSQLAMPAQSILPGDDKYNALVEAGTKRIFLYDGEGSAKPEYISPDPKQAGVIMAVINKIINEIYHTIGMAGERTKEDNAVGIDNSSGVAKAYDFERVNSLLTAKAGSLENAENELCELVMLWHSKKAPEKELVKYPDTFDVRNLFDEFTIAEKLGLVEAPDEVRREQMKQVIDKLFPRLAEDIRKKMDAELKQWPPDPIEQAGKLAEATRPPTGFGSNGTPARTPARKNPGTAKRQGQVTSETK